MKTRKNDHAEQLSTLFFQRDELAPYQYFETFVRKLPLSPEKSLQLALLEDAILTFQEKLFAGDTKSKILVRETEEWIWSSDNDGFFSFENVCEALNISASYLRRHLLLWKNRRNCQAARVSQGQGALAKNRQSTDTRPGLT